MKTLTVEKLLRKASNAGDKLSYLQLTHICQKVNSHDDLIKERDKLRDACEGACDSLDKVSLQLLSWAKESQSGGWSTHQVKPMTLLSMQLASISLEHKQAVKQAGGGK